MNELTSFLLQSRDGSFCETIEAFVLPDICGEVRFHDTVRQYEENIDILLGSAFALRLMRNYDHETGVLETELGKCIIPKGGNGATTGHSVLVTNEELDMKLEKFWKTETMGLNSGDDEIPYDHFHALRIIEEKTIFTNGRYKMPLLFRPGAPLFRNNFNIAMSRLKNLERKLSKKPELYEKYRTAMKEAQTFASRVPEEDIKIESCCYNPHSAVIREHKTTTKVRIVNDASCKGRDGFSINDCLLAGPPLQPDIVGILMRFRTNAVALVGDISKMFFQIGNLEEDKRYHRFLWRDKPTEQVQHWHMNVTTFGFKDAPVKAIYCVRRHVTDALVSQPPPLQRPDTKEGQLPTAARANLEILINMFVDDLMTGADSTEEAYELFCNCVSVLDKGGFSLRKWLSNDKALMDRLPEELRGQVDKPVCLTSGLEDSTASQDTLGEESSEEQRLTKALGVEWDLVADRLVYSSLSVTEREEEITKRTIASATARCFDPLGLVSPFIMQGKILLQQCWREKRDWDEKIEGELAKDWEQWKSQIPLLASVSVPRCIFVCKAHGEIVRQELHAFADASGKAMGAAVYLRTFYKDKFVDSHLVLAKGRVASVKDSTLPRKELAALLMAAKLIRHVAHELNMTDEDVFFCHTDSMTTWQWVNKPAHEWKIFVKNRVEAIQQLVHPGKIFHVAGVLNPADLVSRGCNVRDLGTNWMRGPDFLRDPSYHPSNISSVKETAECANERKQVCGSVAVCVSTTDESYKRIWNISSYRTFLRVTALCLRFSKGRQAKGALSAQETEGALLFWIRQSQVGEFSEDYSRLSQGQDISSQSRLKNLSPFFDTDKRVLKVKGRLQEAGLTDEQTHPIILPAPEVTSTESINADIVARLVWEAHKNNGHAGSDWVLNYIRLAGFWLLGGKRSVRTVIRRCVLCQRSIKKKLGQQMGNLPHYRLERDSKPFTSVGVDAAGPLYLRHDGGIFGGQPKAYVIVFTCLTTRAVHLEVVQDQSTETFLQCIRRLVSRRGQVREFLSDNHKSHIRCDLEISTLFDTMKAGAEKDDFLWRFIPEHGPWYGAVYERLIRTIKETLRKVLGRKILDFFELQTVVTEIEAMINDRPLCSVSTDPDSFLPITPSLIMLGYQLSGLPCAHSARLDGTDSVKRDILRRWRNRQALIQQSWNRWAKDYMFSLTKMQTWQREKEDVQEGNLVLVSSENSPRGSWPLARVIGTDTHNLRQAKSSHVRSVLLRLASGKTLRRPIQHLVLLECD